MAEHVRQRTTSALNIVGNRKERLHKTYSKILDAPRKTERDLPRCLASASMALYGTVCPRNVDWVYGLLYFGCGNRIVLFVEESDTRVIVRMRIDLKDWERRFSLLVAVLRPC